MDSLLHLLADAATGTQTIVGKYGTETLFGLALAAVVTALWQLYIRVAKPAQEAAIKVAEFNCTSAMASRDGMLAFERAMTAQKAFADEMRETAELTARNLEKQERLTSIMIAHTGSTGEDDDSTPTHFSAKKKGETKGG